MKVFICCVIVYIVTGHFAYNRGLNHGLQRRKLGQYRDDEGWWREKKATEGRISLCG